MAEMSQESDSLTQANKTEEKAVYEIGFHLVPTITDDAAKDFTAHLKTMLQKAEGAVLTEEAPKRMTLAYRIERSVAGKREKYTESYFGSIKFELESEHIPSLEILLRTDKNILRYLLIETIREQAPAPRALYSSSRLEGEVIHKPVVPAQEVQGEVSEEELDKSIEALVQE